jgi:hypothetical protein
MLSKQELTRIRVVTFYNNNADQPISYTVKHFMAEGMPRSSVYNIINTYKKHLTTKEKVGKGSFHSDIPILSIGISEYCSST